jgi:RNA-directed DNA polymerase
MTAMAQPLTGAFSSTDLWNSIRWSDVKAEVYRLQMRIAKAVREGRHGKVKALQWLLTHSFSAKLLAVKRVVQNAGSKTPGVDKIIWKTPQQKMQAALSLKRRGYKAKPLRRIYIPKRDGCLRPLSIPVMKCRAMQTLHLLALDPVTEFYADKNSFGFRPKRSCADALERCFEILAKKGSSQYILEADIKSCFDKISHKWLRNNIPMDKDILNKWLSAGYIDNNVFHLTESGASQGGPISPMLLNLTLSGLEDAVIHATSKRKDKVYISIYADDFVITGASKEALEKKVRPTVERFLSERGLELSKEKTKITHIDEGFDFLGTNIRRYRDGKVIRKPSKKSISTFLRSIRDVIKSNPTVKTESLIYLLNPKIRGWTNYHRHVCAKKTFSYIDSSIFDALWRWIKRRHPRKSAKWRKQKYFRCRGLRKWVFSAKLPAKEKGDTATYLDLFTASAVPIKRHIKIKAEATPYDPKYREYFEKRQSKVSNGEFTCTV